MNPSGADRARWDERHRQDLESASLEPSALLIDFAEVLREAPRGLALDVACGSGRNSYFLASLGYEVTALDFSEPAIDFVNRRAAELGVKVSGQTADLGRHDFGDEVFAVALNFMFLDRNLAPRLVRALRPNGILFFETFTVEERAVLGRDIRRDFLLEPNELLRLFAPLRILYYREGMLGAGSGRPRAVAQLIARKA